MEILYIPQSKKVKWCYHLLSISMEVPKKKKSKITVCLRNSISRHMPKRTESKDLEEILYTSGCISILHLSSKGKMTQTFINE